MESTTETSSDESAVSAVTIGVKKKFVCTYDNCNSAYSNNRKLTFHIRSRHTGERPYTCDVPNCSKTYTNSSHLRRHKKVFHTKVNSKIQCNYENCNLWLSNKTNLIRHINRMHNPRRNQPFICKICNQGFSKKRLMQRHLFIHTGEAPFKCDICNKKFMIQYDCNKHKRNHRSYTCQCGKVFERWSNLLIHKKSCDVKNDKCELCEKSFKTNRLLIAHKKLHKDINEREIFLCEYDDCDRFYFYKKNLAYHVNVYHKNLSKNVICPKEGCGKVLKQKQSLKNHLKTHTAVEKVKIVKKSRKDKGLSKKSAATLILGLDLPKEIHKNIIAGEKVHLIEDLDLISFEKETVNVTNLNYEGNENKIGSIVKRKVNGIISKGSESNLNKEKHVNNVILNNVIKKNEDDLNLINEENERNLNQNKDINEINQTFNTILIQEDNQDRIIENEEVNVKLTFIECVKNNRRNVNEKISIVN